MIKHTQAILQQQLTNCSSVFDHFFGLALKGLTSVLPSSFLNFLASVQQQRKLGAVRSWHEKFQNI